MVVDALNAVKALHDLQQSLYDFGVARVCESGQGPFTAAPLRYSGYSDVPCARTGIAKVAYSTSVESSFSPLNPALTVPGQCMRLSTDFLGMPLRCDATDALSCMYNRGTLAMTGFDVLRLPVLHLDRARSDSVGYYIIEKEEFRL